MRISVCSSDVCSSNLPARDIPRANFLTLGIATVIFVSVAFVTVGILGAQDPSVLNQATLAIAAQRAFPTPLIGLAVVTAGVRSEERRGGKECVSTCRSRGSPLS